VQCRDAAGLLQWQRKKGGGNGRLERHMKARGTRQVLLALAAALLLAALLLAACSSGEDDHPLFVRAVSGSSVLMSGPWVGCNPTGGSSSELVTLVFSITGRGTFANLTYNSVADCSAGSPDATTSGTLDSVATGEKSVAWDAAGTPGGLSDPITASTVVLGLTPKAGGAYSLRVVMLVDDRATPNLLYSKDDTQGGPVGAAGYPDEITQDGFLVHL
jgi:hypothetical protein